MSHVLYSSGPLSQRHWRQCLNCPQPEIGLSKCVWLCMLQPNYGLLSPCSAVYLWLFRLPPQRGGYMGCGKVPLSLPPSSSSVGKGGINKGNSWSSTRVTQAVTLKTSMSTHATAHARALKAHQESMESPSLTACNNFCLLSVCLWKLCVFERECKRVASCSDMLCSWTAILLLKLEIKTASWFSHF